MLCLQYHDSWCNYSDVSDEVCDCSVHASFAETAFVPASVGGLVCVWLLAYTTRHLHILVFCKFH